MTRFDFNASDLAILKLDSLTTFNVIGQHIISVFGQNKEFMVINLVHNCVTNNEDPNEQRMYSISGYEFGFHAKTLLDNYMNR